MLLLPVMIVADLHVMHCLVVGTAVQNGDG